MAATVTARGPGRAIAAEVDVANAAAGELEDLDAAHWQQVIDVNLKGAIHGCQAAYPLMQAQGSGHIVNTASLAGLIGGLFSAVSYTTTKHAVVGLSQALQPGVHRRSRLGPHRVAAVPPVPGAPPAHLAVERDALPPGPSPTGRRHRRQRVSGPRSYGRR